MKWFKHESGAHNDEKVRELIHEFGCEGYGVYMVVLELVAEKIDDGLSPLIYISDRVLREKCRVSRQKVSKILSFLDRKTMVFSKLIRKNWEISCPNMLNRLDNWTKKQSSSLVVATKQVSSNKNKEQEKEPEVEVSKRADVSHHDTKTLIKETTGKLATWRDGHNGKGAR